MPGTASILKGAEGFNQVLPHGDTADVKGFLDQWLLSRGVTVGGVAVQAHLGEPTSAGHSIELIPPILDDEEGRALVIGLAKTMRQAVALDRVDLIDSTDGSVVYTQRAVTKMTVTRTAAVSFTELGAGSAKPVLEDVGEAW